MDKLCRQLFFLMAAVLASASGQSDCPLQSTGCSCEPFSGGHDLWCPSSREHNFLVHYKAGQMKIECNTDVYLEEADFVFQV